jgi:hypothetical protein
MDPTAALEDREIVRPTPPGDELIPALTRIAKMRMRVDEPRHDDPTLSIDLADIRRALQGLPRFTSTGSDNDPVSRSEPPAVDGTHVASRCSHARPLVAKRRQGEKSRAPYDEIRFHLSGREERGECRERELRLR